MFCTNCGSKLNPGQKFCTECGQRVEEFEQKQEPEANQKADYSEYTGSYEYYAPDKGPKFTFEQMSSQRPINNINVVVGKPKVLFGLLAILTDFGIYNFCLGYYKKAIPQLIITILSLVASVSADVLLATYGVTLEYNICYAAFLALSLTVRIWSIIDGIRILTGKIKTDAKGIPLR